MKRPLEVTIVGASPVAALGLQTLWQNDPFVSGCRTLATEELMRLPAPSRAALLVLAPQDWREMEYLLPLLSRAFRTQPWLVLADFRLAGAFIFELDREGSTLLSPRAPIDEIRSAVSTLVERRAVRSSDALQAQFSDGASSLSKGLPHSGPSLKELQIGCAVSLGLNNLRIAGLLHLTYGTVKWHVHNLLTKFGLETRDELTSDFERALVPL